MTNSEHVSEQDIWNLLQSHETRLALLEESARESKMERAHIQSTLETVREASAATRQDVAVIKAQMTGLNATTRLILGAGVALIGLIGTTVVAHIFVKP